MINLDCINKLWATCLKDLGIESAQLYSQSSYDPYRRVYFYNSKVYKIEFPEYMTSRNIRSLDLEGEYEIYRLCNGCKNIASPYKLIHGDNFTALILKKYEGKPLSVSTTNWIKIFHCFTKLIQISLSLALKGVAHNDIIPSNILVNESREIILIDFDQATKSSKLNAILRSFFAISNGVNKVHGTVFNILKQKIKSVLPSKILFFLRKVLNKNFIHDSNHELPKITEDTPEDISLIIHAFDIAQQSNASSPGCKMAYYSINYSGYHFPGERPWAERWEILRHLDDYKNKKILELGCNMALLSAFLLKYECAGEALAVDHDPDILRSASLIGKALNVEIHTEKISFDNKNNNWESKLEAFSPDIVFALNVLNWVKDKDRLINFLGRFNKLIFEGHDSYQIERTRLQKVGFKNFKLIVMSERKRPLFICEK